MYTVLSGCHTNRVGQLAQTARRWFLKPNLSCCGEADSPEAGPACSSVPGRGEVVYCRKRSALTVRCRGTGRRPSSAEVQIPPHRAASQPQRADRNEGRPRNRPCVRARTHARTMQHRTHGRGSARARRVPRGRRCRRAGRMHCYIRRTHKYTPPSPHTSGRMHVCF